MWFSSGWVLAFILTFFVIDLILYKSLLGHIAAWLLTVWLCMCFVPWGRWTIFWYVLIFIGVYLAYYFIYGTVGVWFTKMLQKGAPEEKLHRIVGQQGRIHIVNEKTMFKWDDELWPIQIDHPVFCEGEAVKCVAFTDGLAIVEKMQSTEQKIDNLKDSFKTGEK